MTTEASVNVAEVAAERFEAACEKSESSGLGSFSGMVNGIGIGLWGCGTVIFDVENGALIEISRSGAEFVAYKATLPGPRYGIGEKALGEFLFGGNSMEAGLGSTNPTKLDEALISQQAVEELFSRLRSQGIEPDDYFFCFNKKD